MWELDKQGRGLDRVQAEVAAHVFVVVLGLAAVVAHHAHPVSQGFIVGDDHTAVADAAQVLAGKETETRIQKTLEEIVRVHPTIIIAAHCTGWRAKCAMARTMPQSFIWNIVGNLYQL